MSRGERVKAFFKNRWVILGLVTILVATAITTTVLLTRSQNYMTIRALDPNDITQHRVRDYRESRFWLHENGTFSIQIFHRQPDGAQRPILIGIGTFVRTRNSLTITYTDLYRRETIGGTTAFRRDTQTLTYSPTFEFRIVRRQIEFRCPNLRSYFFR